MSFTEALRSSRINPSALSWFLYGCVIVALSCTAPEAPNEPDAGHAAASDAGKHETALPDAGKAASTPKPVPDAGMKDASVGDATVRDATVRDATASDATASDASPSDAAVVDANTPGTDAATSGDAAVGCNGVFCEDFESGALNTTVWTRKETSSGNSGQVQTGQVAHGKYAAQFHAKGGSSHSMIFFEALPESLQKHYFGRMYYYASDFPTESGGHTAYITSSNTLKGYPYSDHHLEVASHSGSKNTWQMTYWQGDGPEYIGGGGQIPKGKWFCLEWEFNDAPDEIGVWVDGQGEPNGAAFRNINNHASNMLGKMTVLAVGFRTWHPMGAPDIDIYIDDIQLDTKRVGCL